MSRKIISFIILFFFIFGSVISQVPKAQQPQVQQQPEPFQQTPQTQQTQQTQQTPQNPQTQQTEQNKKTQQNEKPINNKQPPEIPDQDQEQKHNENDESLFNMENNGKKPSEIKFETTDIPNLTVEVIEIKDKDNSVNYITEKSKLKIKWTVNKDNAAYANAITPSSFNIKLLGNVTEDSITKLFYSLSQKEIATSLQNSSEYEYDVEKLDENYVYNVAVIGNPVGMSNNKSVGVSKTIIYKPYESKSSDDSKKDDNGISPKVYIIIGVGALALIVIVVLISKKLGKNDNQEEGYGLPIQYPTSPKSGELNRVSVVSDNNSEVSWSNLEIAQESAQTKNDAEHIYRTLDKKGSYKRANKPKENKPIVNEVQSYKVVRTFAPTEDDEIRLDIGDDVEITAIFEDGWCEGINKNNNESGVFPRTCVVESEQYGTMIERSKSTLLRNGGKR